MPRHGSNTSSLQKITLPPPFKLLMPSLFQNLIDSLEQLPGVGPKTAERFAFYLLKKPKEEIEKLIFALEQIKNNAKICSICQNIALTSPCEICSDSRRLAHLICVVAEPADLLAIEKIKEYPGVYHVLHGVVNAPDGITPEKLKIKELIQRIKNLALKKNTKPTEIILALNATIEGETTSLYLTRILKTLPVKISKLARGLPQGSDLQYADEITLLNALKGRKEI